MKVVVTIPAYNEAATLGKVLDGISASLKSFQPTLLVLDDGSTDNTAKVAIKHGAEVVSHSRNFGLAESFRSEMREAIARGADIIIHTDADNQYSSLEMQKLLKPLLAKKADLVLGSRFLGTIESMPLINRWGNSSFSKVISAIIGQKITDSQTGFRAFTREVALLPLTSTHTYTQEQVIRAARAHFKISEVPITFAKRADRSRLIKHPLEYAAKAWINILRLNRDYNPLKFFGMIGGFLMFLGVALGIWIIVTFFQTGSVGGIPRVVLAALCILTGIQILVFGFLADMFKK